MQYLSQEWIEAADGALCQAWDTEEDPGDPNPGGTTIVSYTVSGAPMGKVKYHLQFGPDGAAVTAGAPKADADADMALDYDTAVEIAKGVSSAQAAFMQGRLKLTGDVSLLIRGAARLAVVGDALGSLRDRCEY